MSEKKELEIRKKELVEKYGVFLEKYEKMPPLAARIFSILLIHAEKGATFDELVSSLGASKSSISTNLNLLISMNQVAYFTKPGDRKRHFTCFPGRFVTRIEKQLERYQLEYQLGEEITLFKEAFNENEIDLEKKFVMDPRKPYLSFLKDIMRLLEQMRDFVKEKFPNELK